ncbi:MAG: hypothetical protein UIM26_09040 [Longicatena sp.]|nr:hypothetical protein [Longicatena sp.]
MKHILLVKNLCELSQVQAIEKSLADTRVIFSVDLERKCVIVEGNQDMVFIVRKALQDLGLIIL